MLLCGMQNQRLLLKEFQKQNKQSTMTKQHKEGDVVGYSVWDNKYNKPYYTTSSPEMCDYIFFGIVIVAKWKIKKLKK